MSSTQLLAILVLLIKAAFTIFCHVYCTPGYSVLLGIVHTHIFGLNFQEKIFHINFVIQLFIFLYSETTKTD